jgi:hypothetical protein
MTWKASIVVSLMTLFLAFPAAAQKTTNNPQNEPQPKGDTGSGNRPPGTPSWGETSPAQRNPTAPCPAGTSRQNLGQDCKPLDKQGKEPKK